MSLNEQALRNRIIKFLKKHNNKSYKQKNLSSALEIRQKDYQAFKKILREMSQEGEIERFRKNQYGFPQEKDLVEGKLSVTSKGFGFVLMDEGRDVFISYDNLANAMDGDLVRALVFKKSFGKNPEGKILEVLNRSTVNIVGIFREQKTGGMVYPEDDRVKSPLYIPPDKIGSNGGARAKNGQVVVARLEEWADPRDNPHGYITDVLGYPDDPKMDLQIVAKSKDLDLEFPAEVEKEAEQLSEPNWKRLKGRLDLRDRVCFTIDPEDAKDFDDAVSFKQLDNGLFELGVHIADVSHYVAQGSSIDREAWNRGTSVYFVQHVIPMLPERLSNELCSLKPGEDRLAFSVIMQLDSSGKVNDYQIRESVIHSNQRFSYEAVEEIIKGGSHKYASIIHLMQMMSLSLQRKRADQGSIDFDIPEPIFSLDENGIPYQVRPSERLHAHRLIEEFMLLANKTVAEHIARKNGKGKKEEWPFVYRIHEQPRKEDLESFLTLLKNLGVNYQIHGDVKPEDFRNILNIVENLEFKDFVEKVALRSMSKARYSPDNKGHFGLAFEKYTHFTSPIRRYPDLVVHRLLKQYQTGKPDQPQRLRAYLEKTCDRSSEMERNALEAEREYAKIKSMQFLSQKVGEQFDGIISGVMSFGAFVELTHYLVEGLVPMSQMSDDYYIYDKEKYQLVGKRTGKRYRLGDRIRIEVLSVSVDDRKAEFKFLDKHE